MGKTLQNVRFAYIKKVSFCKAKRTKQGVKMKIVFSTMPMRKDLTALYYKASGKSSVQYDGKVVFPVNALLAKSIKKDEKIKVVLLSKDDVLGNMVANQKAFMHELDQINEKIGAHISYEVVVSPFEETLDRHFSLLSDMVDKLEHDAEIICDITYGPKPVPIVMFSMINFAEKYFGAQVKNIVYGKVDFVDDEQNPGKTKPANPVLYDVVSLYYINSMTNVMEHKTTEDAVKGLKILLGL